MKKKKLAILINSLKGGGAEKAVSNIINYFNADYDIHLILLNNEIGFELAYHKITIAIIDRSGSDKSRIRNILKIPLLSRRLKKYLEKNDIQVCFSLLNRSNYINCFLRDLKWNGKILISERSHTSSWYKNNTLSGKIGQLLVRNLYNKADIIVPNSKGIEYDLRTNFGLEKKFCVIHNPIDISTEKTVMQEEVTDMLFDTFTFSHVGRMVKSKNHSMLLNAIYKIRERTFKVIIIGQGPEEETVRQQAKEMGISDKLIFLGYRHNVVRYISRSQCYLMTSDFEGFPNVLLEALACSTPIISTDCPTGPGEILSGSFLPNRNLSGIEEEKYGLLIPVNDSQSLAAAMLSMMDKKELREKYAALGQERAKDFDLPIIMKQFGDLFDRYLAASPDQ